MSEKELFEKLRACFISLLRENNIEDTAVEITCRSLSPTDVIGDKKRKDFPILTGKDVMIQAECMGFKGHAFTDAPGTFSGSLRDILAMDIVHDAHGRGLFVASLNAVMRALGRCTDTVHCRAEGPEECAREMDLFLREQYPSVNKVTLVGYQPALLEMLAAGPWSVRILDLNPANIGQERFGVIVENGGTAMQSAIDFADLILCTGSTLCNGTIVNYILPDKEVLFYGISAAGASQLLGLKRICFADKFGN